MVDVAAMSKIAEEEPIQTPNKKPDPLKSYLDYYKDLDRPGYAVLVTGEWGVGKTYQVQKVLAPEEYIYVSLFGLSCNAFHIVLLQLGFVPAT